MYINKPFVFLATFSSSSSFLSTVLSAHPRFRLLLRSQLYKTQSTTARKHCSQLSSLFESSLLFFNHRHSTTFGDFTVSLVFIQDFVVNVGWAFSKSLYSMTVNTLDRDCASVVGEIGLAAAQAALTWCSRPRRASAGPATVARKKKVSSSIVS